MAKSVSSNFHTNRLTFQNYVDKFQTLCLGLLWYTWPNINIVHSNSCFNTQLTMFRTSPFSTQAREKASETSAKPAGAKQAKRPHPLPPTLSGLPSCAGVQFSRDSIRASNKIRENRALNSLHSAMVSWPYASRRNEDFMSLACFTVSIHRHRQAI